MSWSPAHGDTMYTLSVRRPASPPAYLSPKLWSSLSVSLQRAETHTVRIVSSRGSPRDKERVVCDTRRIIIRYRETSLPTRLIRSLSCLCNVLGSSPASLYSVLCTLVRGREAIARPQTHWCLFPRPISYASLTVSSHFRIASREIVSM